MQRPRTLADDMRELGATEADIARITTDAEREDWVLARVTAITSEQQLLAEMHAVLDGRIVSRRAV